MARRCNMKRTIFEAKDPRSFGAILVNLIKGPFGRRPSQNSNTKGKVLLVHWDEHFAARLASELIKDGWDVITVKQDTFKAYTLIRDRMPDVVLIDLSENGCEGHSLSQALRFARATKDIPVVVFGSDDEDVLMGLENGYITRRTSDNEIVSAISHYSKHTLKAALL